MGAKIESVVLLGVLAVTAYRDWKEQKVYLYIPLIAGIAGLLLHIFFAEQTVWEVLAGVLVGALVVLIAYVSQERVGMGDGIMLMVSGIFLGFWRNVELFFTALLMVGLVALFLLVVKRKGRNYRVPFLPFLLAAYLVQLL